MLTVSKLAKMCHVTPDTVRHYIDLGILMPERNPSNNYQIFSNNDAKVLQFVKQAKLLGFNLKEIQQIILASKQGESTVPMVKNIVTKRIKQTKDTLFQLAALQTLLENALESWNNMPDNSPTGDKICHLIESVELNSAD